MSVYDFLGILICLLSSYFNPVLTISIIISIPHRCEIAIATTASIFVEDAIFSCQLLFIAYLSLNTHLSPKSIISVL